MSKPQAGMIPLPEPPPRSTMPIPLNMEDSMFDMTLAPTADPSQVALTLPTMTGPLTMTAAELEELILHLAWARASMQPPRAPVDMTPTTLVSSVPAIRWQVTEDVLPQQCRLCLLHPGFGWLWIPLDGASFDNLSRAARTFLQPRPPVQ
jgi:hypothetical protein